MAIIATDDFNRSENPLATDWGTITAEQGLKADGSDCVSVALATDRYGAYWDADALPDDQYCQAVLSSFPSSGMNAGVCCRVSNSAETYYSWYQTTPYSCRVYKFVAGSATQIGSDYSIVASPPDTYKLEVSGTTLTPYYNGAAQPTQTDSSISSGYGGLRIVPTLSVSPSWDDFEVGDLTGGGGSITMMHYKRLRR